MPEAGSGCRIHSCGPAGGISSRRLWLMTTAGPHRARRSDHRRAHCPRAGPARHSRPLLGAATAPVPPGRPRWFERLNEHRRAPGRKQPKARNLLERLRDREQEILRFADDLRVPPTNDGSERDLRPVKTQIKVSGCHHADTGAKAWLRVRGTSPPSASTATTSSPHSATPSLGIPGHRQRQPGECLLSAAKSANGNRREQRAIPRY